MTVREQIIQTTCDLLENQGFHATGLNEIVRQSGAPKGSLYYYFPEGKDQITAEAVLWASQMAASRTRAHLAETDKPGLAVRRFCETIAGHIEASGFRAGGPLTIVASETATTNPAINQACRQAYDLLRRAFADHLSAAGLAPNQAAELGGVITAAIEGSIILARTDHSGDPLRQTGRYLQGLIDLHFSSPSGSPSAAG